MGGFSSRLARRAEADRRLGGNQRRPVVLHRRLESLGDRIVIMAVAGDRLPTAGGKARELVGRIGERDLAVDGDAVVVPDERQLGKLQMAGQRDRLLADPFHQAAVAGEAKGAVIDDRTEARGQMPLGDRHADGIGDALAERPGRRLDAGGVAEFGMACGSRAELPEAAELVEVYVLVAEEMQEGVEQHRAVTGRQDEAVAIGPGGRRRIEGQEAGEENRRDVGRPHGQAGMAGAGRLHRISRQKANGIGHVAPRLGCRHGWQTPFPRRIEAGMPPGDTTGLKGCQHGRAPARRPAKCWA